MRNSFLTCAIALTLSMAVLALPSGDSCPEGCELWFDGCNNCQCGEKGMACTLISCMETSEPMCLGDVAGLEPIESDSFNCSPVMCLIFCEYGFQVDENGCDICACVEDSSSDGGGDGNTDVPATTCPEGCKRFFDGCNTCSCSDNGDVGACTEMACFVYGDPKCLDK